MDIPPVLLMDGHRVNLGVGAAFLHRLSHQEGRALPVHLGLPGSWVVKTRCC
ncbi:hypothetical protein ACFP9V_21685 [Deinococcus radiopugnans]|uniref:hypothetical protein n=1 Tax=Deinococcus radiopugnans TaxID=57497 RepID=UPI00361AA87A